jgi:hypothetical protein
MKWEAGGGQEGSRREAGGRNLFLKKMGFACLALEGQCCIEECGQGWKGRYAVCGEGVRKFVDGVQDVLCARIHKHHEYVISKWQRRWTNFGRRRAVAHCQQDTLQSPAQRVSFFIVCQLPHPVGTKIGNEYFCPFRDGHYVVWM